MELYPILLLLFPALAWAQNLYTPPGYSGNRYSFPGGGRQRRPPGYRPVYTHLFPGAQYNNDCGNEHLTCVEKEDCVKKVATTGQTDGQQCPPFFMFDEKLGYCATVDLLPKNNLDAVQACESQGARLLHFENSAEFKQIGKMKENKETFFFGDDAYWLDAYYDDKSETWITRTTREPIIWEQIFTQYDPVAGMTTNLEVVRKIDTEKRCLTVKFNDKHPELLELASIKCEDDKSEIACKLGMGK
ncbi:uncharacterized protein LOC122266484 [Penaeus japonicus]|uniref:uncharacterized protein LOC122266484 n=1 Tax=Penaeus japonicus TaxID=27405 RepID=UPI001C70CF28|nr:uncharacterized protein LOC122266484 [Penaeus japonicus]